MNYLHSSGLWKTGLRLFCLGLLAGLVVRPAVAQVPRDQVPPVPTFPGESPVQHELSARGYGMFLHFGINTFNQTEWSDGKLPVSSYHPTQLDPDAWVRVAKEAGFRHVVLVTKHHDGFCLWDSAVTDYDVGSSPVKTDVVAAVAKACRKYGVQLGLYYSLWDRHEPSFQDKDPEKYVAFMRAQLTELLSNYGPVCEIWLDGGWARKRADWNIPSVYRLIHQLQPGCAVTVNHTIGVHTNANKIGQPKDFAEGDVVRFWPVDFRTKDPNFARSDDPKYYTVGDARYYLPFEHTICLSDRWNWFQKKDVVPARPITFDRLSLVETADMKDLGDGFSQERHYRVERFTIEVRTEAGWNQIYAGQGIGATLSLKLPRTTASALRLTVLAASGLPGFDHIGAYDSRDFHQR